VAAAVSLFVVANSSLPVVASRNDGDGTCLTERTAQAIGILAFVAEQIPHVTGAFEKGGCCLDVADVDDHAARGVGFRSEDYNLFVDRGRLPGTSGTRLASEPRNVARCKFVPRTWRTQCQQRSQPT